MSETTVTLERAQEMATYWHNEALRYESLSQRPGQAHTADGHRIMARDAREFAAAYLAFVDYAAVAEQLAAARREVEAVTQRAIQAEADLATSRAALEDVRRVEAWMEDYPDGRYVDVSRGWFCMVDVRRGDDEDVPAESIAALGRALAQEAGDAKK